MFNMDTEQRNMYLSNLNTASVNVQHGLSTDTKPTSNNLNTASVNVQHKRCK